jgi:ribonuclease HI
VLIYIYKKIVIVEAFSSVHSLIYSIMPAKHFYAVRFGRATGIFTSWEETKSLITGVSSSEYKGFAIRSDAEAWLHHKVIHVAVPVSPVSIRPHANLKVPRPVVVHRPIAPAGCVSVFCDGACPNNGQPGARAGVGVFFGHGNSRNYSGRLAPAFYRQTNQVAEIMAAVITIQRADPTLPLSIFTDSIYVVKAMNEWRHGWKANQWNSTNVINMKHFRKLSDLVDARVRSVYFTHVKGHGTSVGNIAADGLATAGALLED